MRLARGRPTLEENSASVADLTIMGAVRLLAKDVERPDPAVDVWAWAQVQVDEPFTDWDFENLDWLQKKFAGCSGIPHMVAFALGARRDYDLPMLSICSDDELDEAMMTILPYAKGDSGFEVAVSDVLGAAVTIKLVAQRTLGGVLIEWESRKKISAERLEAKSREAWDQLRTVLDTLEAA
jgi:hypothetical protein